MSYSIDTKRKVIELRQKGYSLKEISDKFKIAKSTASVWLSDVMLSEKAQERLKEKQILGQYKTILLRQKRRESIQKENYKKALVMLKEIPFSIAQAKLYSALLWWCEGNKNLSYVRFTSSDPTLISNYLYLLRKGFTINEAKFRVLVHLHAYHNEEKQKKFWSTITKIPSKQFHKSYKKVNTGIRTHRNYQGCIAISYYDVKIANELEAIYNAFTIQRGVR